MKPGYRYNSLIMLLILLAGLIMWGAASTSKEVAPRFFNDRTAEITGLSLIRNIDFGLDGRGQIIGLADSGLDRGSISNIHPDLRGATNGMSRVLLLKSYAGRTIADDPDGHGTHMAGILVGSGQESQGQFRGMAPGASLYFQALLNPQGVLTLPLEVNTLFKPAYEAGVRIHVNGWGVERNIYSGRSREIDFFTWQHNDFLPIFSAGNKGPGNATLSQEANSKNALVVGAGQSVRPGWSSESTESEQPMNTTSRGPAADGRIKPDLLAPGSAVISTASGLITGNYTKNPAYHCLGGSSMSAAVVGGNVALLRQYLGEKLQDYNPSAALIKALLINGVRLHPESQRTCLGWGILDTAGTILALREDLFTYKEDNFIGKGSPTREYKFEVKENNLTLPVRVTLAWNDPPGELKGTQELINDLDLVVIDPRGQQHRGNVFLHGDINRTDRTNNVEMVYIERPMAGTYTVRVEAAGIDEQYATQPFALVYGQNLLPSVVIGKEGENLRLANGLTIPLENSRAIYYLNGKSAEPQEVTNGTQVYLAADKMYMFAEVWDSGGVQMVSTDQGKLFVNINNTREGGYYADEDGLKSTGQQIQYNQEQKPIDNFANGSGIKAVINPFRQKIWNISGNGVKTEGYIDSIDPEKGEMTLIGDGEPYFLNPHTALSFQNRHLDSDIEALPFAYTERKPALNHLVPSMQVSMLVNPQTRQVHFITVYKDIVVSRITEVIPEEETFSLQNGRTYQIFPGSTIYRDNKEATLKDLKPGDWLVGTKLDQGRQLLAINCFSEVNWGQVIYVSAANRSLYLLNEKNEFEILYLSEQVEIYSHGHSIGLNSLEAGSWVRVFKKPDTGAVERIDVAEITLEIETNFTEYREDRKILSCRDGSQYLCDHNTMFIRNGYSVAGQDFLWNENIKVTLLKGPGSERVLVAKVEAQFDPGIRSALLECEAYSLNGALIIRGKTDAEVVTIFRRGGERKRLNIGKDETFSQMYTLQEEEKQISVLAIDNTRRAAVIKDIEIIEFPQMDEGAEFIDTNYYPQREAIEHMKKVGAVLGHANGRFYPDQAIKRVEFWSIVRNLEKDTSSSIKGLEEFKDYKDVPWWGLPAVSTARVHGWIDVKGDPYIHPEAPLTQEELQKIVKKTYAYEYNYTTRASDSISRAEAVQVLYNIKTGG